MGKLWFDISETAIPVLYQSVLFSAQLYRKPHLDPISRFPVIENCSDFFIFFLLILNRKILLKILRTFQKRNSKSLGCPVAEIYAELVRTLATRSQKGKL